MFRNFLKNLSYPKIRNFDIISSLFFSKPKNSDQIIFNNELQETLFYIIKEKELIILKKEEEWKIILEKEKQEIEEILNSVMDSIKNDPNFQDKILDGDRTVLFYKTFFNLGNFEGKNFEKLKNSKNYFKFERDISSGPFKGLTFFC